ncbi:MAG: type II toxin-antitoxin system RelE family toxin [Candidatus Woesearchaeota archaeon]
MFEFEIGDKLTDRLKKLSIKNPILTQAVNKKIREIISQDNDSINRYKNLRYDLKGYKRIHLTKSVILLFIVDIEKNKILFTHLEHIDDAYR